MPDVLHVQLLGTTRLTWNETRLELPRSSRAHDLLTYLVLHAGTAVRRAELAAAFWPARSEERARENLRKPLHLLRPALPGWERFLDIGDRSVTWRADAPYTLDVDSFIADARTATPEADFVHAAALYTGDLLPACYDDWIVPERERLHEEFSRLLRRAIAERELARDLTAALDYALRWRTHDPDDETVQRTVTRLRRLLVNQVVIAPAASPIAPKSEPVLAVAPEPDAALPIAPALPEISRIDESQSSRGQAAAAVAIPSPALPATPDPPLLAPTIQTVRSASRPSRFRRVLLTLAAAMLLGVVTFALLQWWQAPAEALPASSYAVTIQAAATAAATGAFIPIHGTTDGLPRRVRIWTVIGYQGYFWPQQAAFRGGNTWAGVARIGGGSADRGKDLDLLAVLADRAADDQFGAWLRTGYRTGQYPPLSTLPTGTRIVATATVHVK